MCTQMCEIRIHGYKKPIGTGLMDTHTHSTHFYKHARRQSWWADPRARGIQARLSSCLFLCVLRLVQRPRRVRLNSPTKRRAIHVFSALGTRADVGFSGGAFDLSRTGRDLRCTLGWVNTRARPFTIYFLSKDGAADMMYARILGPGRRVFSRP